MFKKYNKVKFLTVLLFFVLLLPMLVLQSDFSAKVESDNQKQIDRLDNKIESSSIITTEIRINGSATGFGAHNWTWAKEQGYVNQGDGSQGNPYIISNLVIDGQNLHSGIVIEDSREIMTFPIYFRIENNIIYNVGGPNSKSAGIKLYKTQYGVIKNNTISSSNSGNYGIHIIGYIPQWGYPGEGDTSKYINVTGNTIFETERGIYIQEGCTYIIVSKNIVKSNSLAGIYIARKCLRITVIKNLLIENDVFGIADTDSNNHWMPEMMPNDMDVNVIKNNTIYHNVYGLYLAQTKGSIISYNNISSNSMTGIYISGSYWNTITNNTINDNGDKGILIVMGPIGSFRNKIYRNEFLRNKIHAVELTNPPPFYIWGGWENNWTWWKGFEGMSPLIGNYWDNYTGKDADDDGYGDTPYSFIGNKDKHPKWNDGIEGHVIAINDSACAPNNWAWACQKFWCSGSSPYIIGPNELWDGRIDAWGKNFGISIIDSNIEFRIEKNTILNASIAGIRLKNVFSVNKIIQNNNISFNDGYGIYLQMAGKVNITNNIINNNTGSGICLYNNSMGASFEDANKITANTIMGNKIDGIYIGVNDCDKNYIGSNLIAENGRYGVYIKENTTYNCDENKFFNNIFRGNKVKNAYDNGTNTIWYIVDMGFGHGNNWDDYDGFDGDDDGIGDTGVDPYPLKPYNIDGPALSKDYYPIKEDGLDVKNLLIDDALMGVGAHNWTWASKRLYISGSGSLWDPYVIKNVKFNGRDTTNAITIRNSIIYYFKIENCTLVDIGGSSSGSAGIYLYNADRGNIINNVHFSTNNDGNYGIFLNYMCDTINITNNIIENEEYMSNLKMFKYGIYLDNSGGMAPSINKINGNIIRNNLNGIFLNNASWYNNITNNEIIDNTNDGILIKDSSNSNQIYYNTIQNNGNGTVIKNGITTTNFIGNDVKNNLKFGFYINSSGNFIYHNNFINNGINAKDDTPIAMGMNTWSSMMDYKGNFWSNYTKEDYSVNVKDADDNGIGDIRYNITGLSKAQDWYPIYDDGHNGSKVVIDGFKGPMEYGGWGWTAGRTWCSGSGTPNDPYVISGLRINGRLNSSCIYITNSQFVYFRIENCELYNSSETESPEPAGGIRLIKVKNAMIINNNISNNDGCGIVLMAGFAMGEETSNITIRNNIIENNNGTGIYVNGSFVYHNLIDNNTISSNKMYGISVSNNAYEITISNNTLYNNEQVGVYIKDFQPSWPMMMWDPILQQWVYEPWDRNYINNNTITLGDTGIGIESSFLVEISKNTITQTESNGIALQGFNCKNNTILRNTIYNNDQYGINFGWNKPSFTTNNYILENNIYGNGASGITLQQCYNSNFSKNTLDGNSIGIALSYLDSYNLFTQNKIFNNYDRGLGIYDLSCESNRIYNNNFTGNLVNGEDFGLSNEWCINSPSLKAGNYWDDYDGKDANDNGIGDTPYDNIAGFMNPEDIFPKWWDAPVIEIFSPLNGDKFSSTAPNFDLLVSEGKGQNLWYVITQTGGTSYYNLAGTFDEEKTGQISPSLWSAVTSSLNVEIIFYINDSKGYVSSMGVTIVKENVTAQIPPAAPSGGDDNGAAATTTTAEQQLEEDFPWWLRAMLTGIISASAGLVLKVSYSVHKHRKEFMRKIAESMERIDNIEKFLKDKLGTDWSKFQETWDKYQKDEISQKRLIKEGKKTVGKKFIDVFAKSKK